MTLLAVDFKSLHQILYDLYDTMMPLCGDMTGVATGLAGLGALFYIAYRVWQSLANAEPIDVFPLLRPFALALCIMFFPTFILGTINTVMSPVVKGCNQMLESQTMDMEEFAKKKDAREREIMMRNPETAYLVDDKEFDKRIEELGFSFKALKTMTGMYAERAGYQIKKMIREAFRELLELLFQAAALVIDTIRTFYLIVLSILGPIAFALAIYDGFSSTLTQWLSRYISVYLWLPVSDLFSSILAQIQINILNADIEAMKADPSYLPEGTGVAYIIFMIIGIVGYFTIPTVASWIVQAGGMNTYNRNLGRAASQAGKVVGSIAGASSGNVTGRLLGK